MNKIILSLTAATFAFTPVAASAAPSTPLMLPSAAVERQTETVQNRRVVVRGNAGRNWARGPNANRNWVRGPNANRNWVRGPGFVRYGNAGYYRGYRGYAYARPGYRYYNGWWFPATAFAVGAVAGAAIAAPYAYGSSYYGGGYTTNVAPYNNGVPLEAAPQGIRTGSANGHTQWCLSRYRSYDARSDTFQPYEGPRQRCVSPM
jgi:hypothetical protein